MQTLKCSNIVKLAVSFQSLKKKSLKQLAKQLAAKQLVIMAPVIILSACSGLPDKGDELAALSPTNIYSQAEEAMNAGDWTKCTQYFTALQGRDPFGPLVQQAQLNAAYCYYRDNEIASANQVLDRFIQLYPNHQFIDYALYMKGLSNFNDDLGLFGRFSGQDLSERDPQAMLQSYEMFKSLVERFPHSQYTPDAVQRLRYIVNALASHEMHVAQYYFRRSAYPAAINRAQNALKKYEGAPANQESLKIMIQSYRALGEKQLAADAEKVMQATYGNHTTQAKKTRPWWQIWNNDNR